MRSNPQFWRDDRHYVLQSTPMSFEGGTGIWIPLQLLETSICRTRIAQQQTIPCCFALVCLSQSQIQWEFTCFHSFVILLGFPVSVNEAEVHGCFWGAWLWAKCFQNIWSFVWKCATQVWGLAFCYGRPTQKACPGASYPCFCLKIYCERLWGKGPDCVLTSFLLNKLLGTSVMQKEERVWTLVPPCTWPPCASVSPSVKLD